MATKLFLSRCRIYSRVVSRKKSKATLYTHIKSVQRFARHTHTGLDRTVVQLNIYILQSSGILGSSIKLTSANEVAECEGGVSLFLSSVVKLFFFLSPTHTCTHSYIIENVPKRAKREVNLKAARRCSQFHTLRVRATYTRINVRLVAYTYNVQQQAATLYRIALYIYTYVYILLEVVHPDDRFMVKALYLLNRAIGLFLY